ncbi:MAG TPA: Xaa-Pro peptidase family protein [Gemmatales bacterium]|nr:Xaa-Pro peptidase family protein [Gemmatales bacterium]
MLDPSLTAIPHPYAQRRERLAHFVKEQGLHGMLVTNETNVRYLTGFTGDSTYLLINNQFNLLISDGRYTQQIREECPGFPVYIRPPGQKLHEATIEQLKSTGWSNVGVESANVTLAVFEVLRTGCPTIQWKAVSEGVEQFRMIKDESEILAIQKSIDIAEQAYLRFRQYLRPTDNEIGLHHRLEMLLRDGGAEKGSFPAIVGVGPRAALPHAPPTKLPVGENELLLLDWGARCDGYVSDLTRTLPLHKNISSRLKPIYDAVLAAQQAAAKAIKPGIPGSAIDVAARQEIEARGFSPYSHGLGHGIGLDVHEGPQMRLGVETLLQPGMVVTIEPGIYLPEWGGVRIEDNYLITPGGAQALSTLPSDFDSVMVKW